MENFIFCALKYGQKDSYKLTNSWYKHKVIEDFENLNKF